MFAGSYFAKALMPGMYFPPVVGSTPPPPPPPLGSFRWPYPPLPEWWPIDLDDEELTFWVM